MHLMTVQKLHQQRLWAIGCLWLGFCISISLMQVSGSIVDGWDASAKVYRINVGAETNKATNVTVLRHVDEGWDITLKCQQQPARWYYQNALLASDNTLRLSRAQASQSGNYACKYGKTGWANVSLLIGFERNGGDIADMSKMENSEENIRLRLAEDQAGATTYYKVANDSSRTAPKIRGIKLQHPSIAVGDNAKFECQLEESAQKPKITWLYYSGVQSIAELTTRLYSTQNPEELDEDIVKLVTTKDKPQMLGLGNVQIEDAGWYICLAENSEGRSVASAFLEVSTTTTSTSTSSTTTTTTTPIPTTTTERKLDDEDNISEPVNSAESAPKFKNEMSKNQHCLSGARLALRCPAEANPSPNITWTRNGHAVERRFGKPTFQKYGLFMDDAITDDSDTYTCTVCNYLGCIHFDFDVKVFDRLRARPIISDKFPQNQTALVNTNVTIECRALSDNEPSFRWIRVIERNLSVAHTQDKKNVTLIALPIVDTYHPEVLHLTNVTHAQEGWYTCVASNSFGESKASVYLRVVDRLHYPEIYALLRSHPIGITVAAFVILALFLLGSVFIVYILRRMRREKHRIETVHQWSKKIIIYRPPSVEGNSCGNGDLQMPIIKIEKQRTTFSTTSGNADPNQAFNEYEFPLDSHWEIPRQQLTLGSILGEGAFGRVVMAKANDLPRNTVASTAGSIVAVKMVKEEHTDADMASLVREMEVMKMIGKHINIINLLGCCSQGGPLWVIVEFAPHGNLKDFLKQNRPGGRQRRSESDGYLDDKSTQLQLGEKELTMFAFQIARGMEYLASRRCIHRDLAARNVLVSDGYVMKIADFGLARDIQDTDYYRKNTNGRLPIKWMAPESLQEKFYDSQSDVWSYGVLLWEIMTYGEQPYSSPQIMSAEELYSYLITGQRMEKPTHCSLNIYIVMRQCWHFESCARPTFAELVESLDGILQQASNNPNDAYLDLSMPMLETPPSSCDEDDGHSDCEIFRDMLPHRYQYTYKFN